jgi:hypothetical protein
VSIAGVAASRRQTDNTNAQSRLSVVEKVANSSLQHIDLKIVDKKGLLRTISNTGIYCSNDIVGTVILV